MELSQILTPPKVIAVVGLSDKPERPSYRVASYLMGQGFTIIPVNPMITEVMGLTAYPSLSAIPKDTSIDVVDIFRKPEEVANVVQEIIETGLRPIVWMQEGVISPEAKQLAEAQGMQVIMDKCMMKMHQSLHQQPT